MGMFLLSMSGDCRGKRLYGSRRMRENRRGRKATGSSDLYAERYF